MQQVPETVGPYRLERELGRGGMGVVYLARDPRLDRTVAIKALPADVAADPDRLARFQREAKVLAALNHPHIAALYGLEEAHGRQYLVLEHVAGQTLEAALRRGPLPIDEALAIGVAVAAALEAAHEQGVVHRDLKPGNIMVAPDGGVKVLDFGVARIGEAPAAGSASNSTAAPTIATPPSPRSFAPADSPTMPGVVMGTAGYMSPEQARGKTVDRRSDIFSFGCLLFEMLAGRRLFEGETVSDVLGATMHKDLDLDALPPATPPAVRYLLRRCLARDRAQRLRDIGDARLELEAALADPAGASFGMGPAPPVAPARPAAWFAARGWRALVVLVIGGLLIAAGAWSLAIRHAGGAARPPADAAFLTIPSRTSAYFRATGSRISPDGQHVFFHANPADGGPRQLWVRPLASFAARPLPETSLASGAFWSHDSRAIALHQDGKLWSVAIDGGSRRLIAQVGGNLGASWGADDVILLGRLGGGLLAVPASGGTPQVVTEPAVDRFEESHAHPRFLPDSPWFFYVGLTFPPDEAIPVRRLYAGRLGSSEQVTIGEINSPAWLAGGDRLVYVEDGSVRAAPFDVRAMRIAGAARTIADEVWYFRPTGETNLSVSRDGVLVYVPVIWDTQLTWFDRRGVRGAGVAGPSWYEQHLRISPDGRHVAVAVMDRRTSLADIWIYGLQRDTARRLTSDPRWEGTPIWSRDGATIYFSWDRDGPPDIFALRADGAGEPDPVYRSASAVFSADTSPDDASLAFWTQTAGTALQFRPLRDGGPARTLWAARGAEYGGRIAPDGAWIAYMSNETGRSQVYLASLREDGRRVQVSTQGGSFPAWGPDGRRLYYLEPTLRQEAAGTRLMEVDLGSPAAIAHPLPRLLFETRERIEAFDIAPDGARFLLQLALEDAPEIRVILNW